MTADPDRKPGMFPAPAGARGWRRRQRDLAARIDLMHDEVRAALHTEPTASVIPDDLATSAEVVSTLAGRCIDQLRATAGTDGITAADGDTSLQLCHLILDLQELSFDLYQHDLNLCTRRFADCAAGLQRLRTLPSSVDLLDQVCEELVHRCGFGRAVLSRVEDSAWHPWMAYFSNSDEFESWFARWVDRPIPLEGMTPETRLLTDCRPAVVYDTANAPVHRPIIVESGRSKSYVVAPVMRGTEVVGFLHADHHPSSRRVDEVDRDVLWMFADGFSHIYERAVLAERLRTQRNHVREILSSAVEMMNDFCDAGIDLSRYAGIGAMPGDGARPAPIATAHTGGDLTARESEVLELMVAGATNSVIAETLVIAEETVKSHVKHILRKLGAVNRSQAIAGSLGMTMREIEA
ncbi:MULTISPECIES: LuxR C-terminal-related transcriptional regulator [Protofrankia]|uniref:Transcriptional regulator n=1 Tax=Protofrankia coriariae TaxID=1562887 RepID=A0ABR5F386_9ACTN|nr:MULTISPECIES: LuxR C-terminal-related transcriptional regulator [Protofrankia]KLL11181.1 transcriptional regulator [Protofrankia coriariae]ONH35843.1 helix-turn-helix transcriptional regulator [Protofrankia sp. BMG5.30]